MNKKRDPKAPHNSRGVGTRGVGNRGNRTSGPAPNGVWEGRDLLQAFHALTQLGVGLHLARDLVVFLHGQTGVLNG